MNVICPNCGFQHSVETRGKTGGGTRRALKTLNWNKRVLCEMLMFAKKDLTVREVQKLLYDKRLPRLKRGEKDPSGGWNYHDVQANLSLLVGNDIISMNTVGEDSFDGQDYFVTPTPRYYVSAFQEEQYRRIKDRNWVVSRG